jgi:hypothetical protein
LQCDGYAAYADLGEGITYAGCLAHLRRGFVAVLKLVPQNPLPAEVVELIKPLYAVEQAARERGLAPAGRRALRQEQSVPLMAKLHDRSQRIRQATPPGAKLVQACDYALR